jgi:CoA:oxalate CoA-transferase
MLDCQVALMENAIVRYTATGEVPGPVGLRHPLSTPHQALPASDGWVVLAGVKDHTWPLFCAKIGRDDLIVDERFGTNALRTRNYRELEPILFETFRRRTVAQWLAELGDFCLIGPMNTVDKVVADPQVAARDMIVELPTWTGGSLRVSNTPVKLSRTPGGATRGASRPGEHTAAILREAGLSDEQIEALIARGIAWTGPEADPEALEAAAVR